MAERRAQSDQWETIRRDHRRQVRSASGSATTEREAPSETESDGRVGLLVADRCDYLIREFFSYKEEHVGTTGAQDHCLDALRYAVMGVTGP